MISASGRSSASSRSAQPPLAARPPPTLSPAAARPSALSSRRRSSHADSGVASRSASRQAAAGGRGAWRWPGARRSVEVRAGEEVAAHRVGAVELALALRQRLAAHRAGALHGARVGRRRRPGAASVRGGPVRRRRGRPRGGRGRSRAGRGARRGDATMGGRARRAYTPTFRPPPAAVNAARRAAPRGFPHTDRSRHPVSPGTPLAPGTPMAPGTPRFPMSPTLSLPISRVRDAAIAPPGPCPRVAGA